MKGIMYVLNMSSAEQYQLMMSFGFIVAEVLLVALPVCWYSQWNDARRETLAKRWGKEI